jgi:putative endonuclease
MRGFFIYGGDTWFPACVTQSGRESRTRYKASQQCGAFSILWIVVSVYIIESLSDATHYVGMAIDVERRLKEHNAGKNRFTKGHLPWKVVYTEVHDNWSKARVREKYLKSSAGRNWLKKYLGDTGSLPA